MELNFDNGVSLTDSASLKFSEILLQTNIIATLLTEMVHIVYQVENLPDQNLIIRSVGSLIHQR